MASPPKTQFTELSAWMAKNGRKIRGFSLEIGVDKMTLSRLLRGDFKRLTPQVMAKVTAATEGKVGDREWAAFLSRMVPMHGSRATKRKAAA